MENNKVPVGPPRNEAERLAMMAKQIMENAVQVKFNMVKMEADEPAITDQLKRVARAQYWEAQRQNVDQQAQIAVNKLYGKTI